jgi:hypothetical protein
LLKERKKEAKESKTADPPAVCMVIKRKSLGEGAFVNSLILKAVPV